MTDPHPFDAGPYVLGALSPEDRRVFEEHLADCPRCRAEVQDFAGLPGLLSRLPVAEALAEPPAPPSLLPALLREAGVRRRSRRRRAVLAGVAAAFALAAGSVALTEALHRPAGAPAVAFSPAEPGIRAYAEATVTDVSAGTRIDMTCRYEGALDGKDREYVLLVVPKDGQPQRLSSWPVLSADEYRLAVVAPLPRDRIAEFEVTNATGKSLLTLRP
jgi:anti-sigma factor RsiW